MKKLFFSLALALCYTSLYAQFTAADFQNSSLQVLHVNVSFVPNCPNMPSSPQTFLRTQQVEQRNRWIGMRMNFEANTASFFRSSGMAIFERKNFTVSANQLTVNGTVYSINARPRAGYHSLTVTEGCLQMELIVGSRVGNRDVRGLRLYYRNDIQDNFSLVASNNEDRARDNNYNYVRVEGRVLAQAMDLSTVALSLYYSAERNDYVLCANPTTINDLKAANYQLIQPLESTSNGFVHKNNASGTVALKLFYHDGRADHMTTATAQGEADALGAGYRYVRVEGYVYP